MRNILRSATVAVAIAVGSLAVAPTASASVGTFCNTTGVAVGINGGAYKYQHHIPFSTINASYTCYINVSGDSGAGVKALQKSIIECYHIAIDYDGIYGPQTRDALKVVQKWEANNQRYFSTIDGLYGPNTRNAMLWVYAPNGNCEYIWSLGATG